MSQAAAAQMLERPLPHSAEAERAILGAIILDNALVNQAIELLRPDDFYIRANRFVFRSMIALSERGAEINPILLGEELRREGVLEQVGGISYVSELTYGVPSKINLPIYAKVVHDKVAFRRMVSVSTGICGAAIEEEEEPSALLDRIREAVAALEADCARPDSGRRSLLTSFSELMSTNFEDGEEIAFHARRGEVVLVQSVTNHGKSTVVRNAALALVTGGDFSPVVELGEPRRVLLLNFEGSGGWFQSDLRVMTRDFTAQELELTHANFFPTHAPMLDGELLSLSRQMRALESAVRRADGVDVLIIDTASAAFYLKNENDNAEVANFVMKPLVKLARRLNCLIIIVHHVGKAKAEEGAAREQAHRGRGASAWGDFSASIFNLDADQHDQERVTITCAKRKNGGKYERVLRLSRESRWFKATDETLTKPVTNDDLLLDAMDCAGLAEISTAEIEKLLASKMSRATVMNCLRRLANAGKVRSPRRGQWSLVRSCLSCLRPLEGLDNCTNCDQSQRPLSGIDLRANAAASSNGNGVGGEYVGR